MAIVDTMPEGRWEIEDRGGDTLVFVSPERLEVRPTGDTTAGGRPIDACYVVRTRTTVTLGKEWDRSLGRKRCALAAVAMGQCATRTAVVREIRRIPRVPHGAAEAAEQRACDRFR
jgi:hypothetical protein